MSNKKIIFIVFVFCTSLLIGLFILIHSSQAQNSNSQLADIIVFHKPIPKSDRFRRPRLVEFLNSFGSRTKYEYDIIDAVAVRGFPTRFFGSLNRNPDIIGILNDEEVHAHLSESLPIIGSDIVNNLGIQGDGVVACVVDTGVDCTHPDLSGNCVEGRDFVNDDDDPSDGNGHGTHVAGIVQGVAPGVLLKVAQVLNSSGSGSFSDVIAGIEWCIKLGQFADPSDHLAKVINMSLGGGSFTGACDGDTAAIASNNAVDEGAVVVASSGNDGTTNAMGTPACASEVIAVGATYDFDGTISSCCQSFFGFCIRICSETVSVDQVTSFSNGGPELDVTAPGAIITSTCPGNSYCDKSGTSILVGKDNTLLPSDIREKINNSALDLGEAGHDNLYGNGRIDAVEALNLVGPSCEFDTDCDDGNVCTDDSCDIGTGSCVNDPVADGTSCDDGDACSTIDECSSGSCVGSAPIDCDDGIACTDDSCDPGTGSCVNDPVAEGTSCDDGDLCTTNDQCSSGVCGGTSPDCDDGNVCTTDSCDPGTGCVNVANSEPCNDGIACTTGDVCSSGACNGTEDNSLCSDGNDCTDDVCTVDIGCSNPNNTAFCDDGDACTDNDQCSSGSCVGVNICSTCGDGVCEGSSAGEDCTTCSADCPSGFFGTCCGDGVCGFLESFGSGCPVDC